MNPTEDRLAMRRNGYHPLPVEGKRPPLEGWREKLDVNDEEIRFWRKTWCWAHNTGANAKFTPGLDIDILDPAAAVAVETLAREHFEERGDILVRIGLSPKRLIPLRTDEPFKKLRRDFVAPNGKKHAIEILGDGQQWVAYGIHPDTGKPYGWHGGEPATTKREKLPNVRLADMQNFLDAAVKLLVEEFNYVKDTSDGGDAREPGEPQASAELIAAALAVIPNEQSWDGWNNVGMATWRATAGSAAGFVAFDAWSRKSPKYDARNTTLKWAGYFKSPPTHIGAGTIFYLADQVSSNWRPPPPEPGEPLPYVDLSLDLRPREWLVPNRIPMYNVTLLSGEGAIGKSKLALQLSGAVVLLGAEWIGTEPGHGPVLYVSCEEDDDELRRQTEDVAVHLGSTRQEMAKRGLRPLSFAGKDAILAQPRRNGIMQPTRLFKRIQRDALKQRPKLIIIDTAADAFGGKEIDRAQTRQFITMLRGLAIECGSAVVLIAHPSLEGIRSGSGLSGSTGWHNGPRARMYFKADDDDDDDADPTLRILEIMKSNYGPVTEAIRVRWKDGVFVTVDPRQQELDLGEGQAAVDNLFLTLLRRFTEQGRNVSPNTSPTYAPSEFAKEPEAKAAKATKEKLADAMARLFAAKPPKIRVVEFGSPSRLRSKIVEASNGPSNAFQHLPTGCCHTPPNTPTPVGRGKGALEGPAPPNGGDASEEGNAPPAATGQEADAAPRHALRQVLAEWRAAYGVDKVVSIAELLAVDHRGLRAALLAVAAMPDSPSPTISNVLLGRWLRDFADVHLDRLFLRYERVDGRGSQLWSLREDNKPPPSFNVVEEQCPPEMICIKCGERSDGAKGPVKKIACNRPEAVPVPLHTKCAEEYFDD